MKILFVYSTMNCICTTKCCFELANALKKYSITEIINYKKLNNDIVSQYDVIILQRIGDGEVISEEHKENIFNVVKNNKSKKFIYLIDDLVLESQGGLPKELASLCGGVMCSSDRLCDNFKKYNKNIYRFHTFIDCAFYDSVKRNNYEKFTVSWVSSGGVGIDIINKLIQRKESINIDFNLVAIGGQSYKVQAANYIKCYRNVSELDMIRLIKGTDILLNPMTVNNRLSNIIKSIYKSNVNEFLNSKAEIKYLTAGMCESCLITSETECYKESIVNGVNGFRVSDDIDEWIKLIIELYNNKDYLERLKQNAYEDVKSKYDINIIVKEIYNQLNNILN